MTNEQILKKSIEKVVKNGWRDESWEDKPKDISGYYNWLIKTRRINDVIFSQDFAKHLWGEKEYTFLTIDREGGEKLDIDFHGARIPNVTWQYHLQQMVLEEEPLKYIEKFL